VAAHITERRIEEWKRKLIDPSRRNRLIYYRPTKSGHLTVTQPDAEAVFRRLTAQGRTWEFWLPPEEDSREQPQPELFQGAALPREGQVVSHRRAAPKEGELVCGGITRAHLARVLKNLYREANTNYNERGVRVLHLACGTLVWKDNREEIRSPLILCPVELQRETARVPYTLSLAEDDAILNPALQAKLAKDFNLSLPEAPDDWEEQSLADYFAAVADTVRPREWTIEPSVVIGLFSFHKLVMYQDLEENAEAIKSHPFISALTGGKLADSGGSTVNERELDTVLKPEETYQILDADSSQQQCIQAALSGQSFVLQGPPGTGKSQTIANIIAEFIARGRTVLFVSEKMAALEVVANRLREAHLDEFALELHSHKADKREVVAELKRCLDGQLMPSRLPSAADFEKLKQARQALNGYVLALHCKREPLGESARDVMARLAALEHFPLIPTPLKNAQHLRPQRIAEWGSLIKRLETVWQIVEEGEDSPWIGCRETEYSLGTRARWSALLDEVIAQTTQLKAAGESYASELGVNVPQTFADASWLVKVGRLLNQSPGAQADWLTSANFDQLFAEASRFRRLSEQYQKLQDELARRYDGGFFDLAPDTAGRFERALAEAAKLLSPEVLQGRRLIDAGRRLLDFAENTRLVAAELGCAAGELGTSFELPAAPLSVARMRQIARLGELCGTKAKPEAAWLTPHGLQQVRETVQRISPDYENYRALRRDLLTRYDESVCELDLNYIIESSGKLSQYPLRASLDESIRLTDCILSKRINKAGELAQLAALLKDLKRDAAEACGLLGYSAENLTVERARGVGRLAVLCGAQARPQAHWLEPTRLQSVRQTIKKARPLYEEYRAARNDLLKRYDDGLFNLELERLIESFDGLLYRPPFCWLNPRYHRDQKAIRRATRANVLPANITGDLLQARETLRMRKKLEVERAEVQRQLGDYDQGYDTDFDTAEGAVEVAAQILGLSGGEVPAPLVRAATFGTIVPSQIPSLGEAILSAVRQWEELARRLPEILRLDELARAQEIVTLRWRLDAEREKVSVLLGGHDKAYETDFGAVQRAVSTATEILDLVGSQPLSAGLTRLLTEPSAEAERLAAVGVKSFDSLLEWEEATYSVSGLLPAAFQGVALKQVLLSDLSKWGQALLPPLSELCDLVEFVLSFHRDSVAATLGAVQEDLARHEELAALRAQVEAEAGRLREVFGGRFQGIRTEWGDVLTALEWAQAAHRLFGTLPMPEQFVRWAAQLGSQTPAVRGLEARLESFDHQFSNLEAEFDAPGLILGGEPLRESTLAALLARCAEMRGRVDELQHWVDFKRMEAQFAEAGLAGVLKSLVKNPPPAAQLTPIFQKSVYHAWVSAVFDEDIRLKDFRGRHHEQVIDEFRKTDEMLVQLASHRVIQVCNDRRPRPANLQAQDSETGILRREAAKRRKHLPVRALFDRTPNLLPRLKPCLMMSPLSVSQFLPADKLHFDLVIFDEASQIFTEDAVGAIYRGKQLIVAGDSKQLPPTDFFKNLDSDDGDADEPLPEAESSADFSSVLEECESITGLPVYWLRWHYRSRHESLIAFSNHQFYKDNLLVTFPSAQHKHDALGVEFVYLTDGIYDRGGRRVNRREAEVVADRVFEHFAAYPGRSIGVVAFSQAQMAAIEDEIERRRGVERAFDHFFREDRLEGFFVKNLENVQGDERDVIIFSVGYGRDQHGRLTMAFGPINRTGGERRLNVAVTRAREKIVLVSSIKAADIDLSTTDAAGVLNLHRYLDYAERGTVALELSTPQGLGEPDSPFEEDVAGEIKAMGYEVVPQVGCSGYRIDIGVIDPAVPGRFLLGVECDGATYHSAATARDRDRLRQRVLERLGWRIHRVWSPDWMMRRGGEIQRIRQAIEEARRGDGPQAAFAAHNPKLDPTRPESGLRRVTLGGTTTDDALPGTRPYEPCVIGLRHSDGEFHEPRFDAERAMLLAEVVRKEGPIHFELAVRRVIGAWGLARSGQRIIGAMQDAVESGTRRGAFKQRGEFLWPAEMAEVPVRVPVSGEPETRRDIAHIPPEEIQSCLLLIASHAVGVSVEDLVKEAANVFGFERTGDRIKDRLLSEVTALKRRGLAKVVNGYMSLPER
jgi:very-short-patch-repair endonuclease